MSVRSSALLLGAGALAAAGLVGPLLVLIALNTGGSAGIGPVRLQLAAGYDRRADDLLATRPGPSRTEADLAIAASRHALDQYPYDVGAWLRIAYADSLKDGGLSPVGLAALQRSYDLIAVDPSQANWRIRFCLEHWSRLTPELRKAVRAEVFVLGQSYTHRRKLRANLAEVVDPAGRLVAQIWSAQLSPLPPKS